MKKRIVHDLANRLTLINNLFYEAFLESNHTPVRHFCRDIAEKSMSYKSQHLINLEVINLHLLLAVRDNEIVRESIKHLWVVP